ncbi:uncharacterized protein LOC108410942 [Pygocentrus nattereri]|uniref:uncharacterized protein LOC108410942 n=1 Tax=Pygocentrus nattereri TaxID=42514 RepID=UPI001891F12B|nr:uncharacterized protein LOC108410942 [Pygocentrus nattereri]
MELQQLQPHPQLKEDLQRQMELQQLQPHPQLKEELQRRTTKASGAATTATTPTAQKRTTKTTETTTTATTPTTQRTTKATETANATESSSGGTTRALWKVLIIIAVSCLLAVALVLFLWKNFYKRKAVCTVKQKQDHLYDCTDNNMPTTQAASNQQNPKEPVYHLVTQPVQITGDQQSTPEATEPLGNNPTQTEQVEQLYAKIKKPGK